MSIFARVVSYLLNDALVKTLANSKTFQRFALKTDALAKQARTQGTEAAEVAQQKLKEQVSKVKNAPPAEEGQFNFHAFLKEFGEEVTGKSSSAMPKKKVNK
jgi:hypothetical protein